MSERLSTSMLKDEVKAYDEFIEIPFTVQNKEIIVKLYPYFSPTAVNKLVQDIGEFIKKMQDEELQYQSDEFHDIVGYFILRHFTDIKFSKGKKAKTLYDEFKIVRDSQVFQLLLEAIPQQSIVNVYDRINQVIELSAKLENLMKDKLSNLQLENKEVFENYTKKKSQ